MRILHVSNFGDKHNARLYWNQCFKKTFQWIDNYEMELKNWDKAYEHYVE